MGTAIAEAAKAASLDTEAQSNFTRLSSPLPSDVTSALFEGKVGDAALGQTADGYVVAVLSDIKSLEGADDQVAINALRRELSNGVVNDLQGQFVNALRGQYQVTVDRGMLNRLFVSEQQ